MQFTDGVIHDVVIKDVKPYVDSRGSLAEVWREDEMRNVVKPVMSYISYTNPDTARGPHEHVSQSDYFVFLGSSEFEVRLWDNRKDSVTYGKRMIFVCNKFELKIVTVPPGVIHGYKNIGKEIGLIINLPDRLYAGENKKEKVDEIRHENDPQSPFFF